MNYGLTGLQPDSQANWVIAEDPRVSFLIRVLIEDGLHIPPLTSHARLRGPLQDLGLTPESWQLLLNDAVEEWEAVQDASVARARALTNASSHHPPGGGRRQILRWHASRWRAARKESRDLVRAAKRLSALNRWRSAPPELRRHLRRSWKAYRIQRRQRHGQPGWIVTNGASVIELLPPNRIYRFLDIPYPGSIVLRVGHNTLLCASPVQDGDPSMIDLVVREARRARGDT